MKMNLTLFLVVVSTMGPVVAHGQPLGARADLARSKVLVATNVSEAASLVLPGGSLAVLPEFGSTTNVGGGSTESAGLRLHFRSAPLETVLDYLSEAAGFIIVLEAQPKGTVDVWSEQPLSREEACEVLNSALIKNGYAAVRKGRTLTIVNRDEAKTHALPVKLGSDPGNIPQNEEMVTQIIPVRFIEAAQLIKDLQPLVSTRATMTANESANTIAITDTQASIHRVAEIINAIDSGAEDFTAVRVFPLKNADPTEMADLLSQLFPNESRSQDSQPPMQFGGGVPPGLSGFGGPLGFGGPPGFSPGGTGTGGGSTASSGSQKLRTKKRTGVVAVADPRTAALVVSAPKDLIPQIELIVADLDSSPARKQSVAVYQLKNARSQEVRNVLQNLFQKSTATTARNTATQTDPLETRSTQQQQQNQLSGANIGTGFGGNARGRGVAGFGGGVGQ